MKVEIWSDVMCPFCYIGKRRFEQALSEFPHKDDITVEWKSFQLDPDLQSQPDKTVSAYLAERKGWSLDQAKQANDHVTRMAAQAGLTYKLDKAIVANSFDAHLFSHYAATKGKGDAAEESLFRAYFTEGKNIADHETLAQLGTSIGLDAAEVKQALATPSAFAAAVEQDIYEAQQIGVRGVPFFVLDRKFAVSGAQPAATFLEAITKAYEGWGKENKISTPENNDGEVCTPDGECN